MDFHTSKISCGRYARVCIEVDTSKPIPPYVRINNLKQEIAYELNTCFCIKCGRIGHFPPNCTINEQSGTGVPRQPEETKENQTEWQIIEKRRRNFNKHSYNNPTQENKFREVINNLRSRGNITDVMTTGSQSKRNQGQRRPKHKTQESRDINQKNAFAVLEDDLPGNFQSTGKMVEENYKKTNQTDNAYTAQEANSEKNTWSSMDVDKECMQKELNIEFKYYTQAGNASNAQEKNVSKIWIHAKWHRKKKKIVIF